MNGDCVVEASFTPWKTLRMLTSEQLLRNLTEFADSYLRNVSLGLRLVLLKKIMLVSLKMVQVVILLGHCQRSLVAEYQINPLR